MIYTCCEENRRASVDSHPTLNGIDWLEVLDTEAPFTSPRQRTLMLRLLKSVPAGITPENLRITGGERIRDPGIEWVGVASAPPPEATVPEQAFFTTLDEPDHILLIRTTTAGDFSTYQLSLAADSISDAPLTDFDPRLSAVEFEFKVECPSDFDCAPVNNCDEEVGEAPQINYLARDYNSLRRLVMDRFGRLMPGWQDISPADLATTLGELIAYVGDLQHYQLDGITTEAYLHSARRRTSLRRHALLVDYRMHEGCNARTWLHLDVTGGPFDLPEEIRFYTRVAGVPANVIPASSDERALLRGKPLVFEPMHDITLRDDHNTFSFYTWGDTNCCLPKGATSSTLQGHWPDIAVGDVLVFQEIIGPLSGEVEDADPSHSHAVRLTAVRALNGINPLLDPLDDTPITEIQWHAGDALPFPVCISAETDEAHGSVLIDNVSIVLGNNVLVDHGYSIDAEALGKVPAPRLQYSAQSFDACQREMPVPLPPRFRPELDKGPLTHQGTITKTKVVDGIRSSKRMLFDSEASASAALLWQTADAMPAILLDDGSDSWSARRDLLGSRASDNHFVTEIEDSGSTRLRFGDDRHGNRPDTGTMFGANYRIGNGVEGNVGAGSLAHALTNDTRIIALANPLPAWGGVAPEAPAEVRRRAPQAFRTQERAVTEADYADVTERLDGVQQAAAGLRWTGSWHTVFTTVDRDAGAPVDEPFSTAVIEHLDRYRMAGHDLRVNDPEHVSLEIDMLVCVDSAYFRSNVRQGLLDAFTSRLRADNERGVFHPDHFSFGQTVFLSPLYAAARDVPGVESVQIMRFHRQGQEDPKPLADGFMKLDRLEIARLDNDPNFPEHGVLRLKLHGGK